ncbi:putative repeat protein (TIGR01451 family)/gliding motility-associated-like protein [Flavobacterium sp. 28A]|uniref:DUF7507 domain-containing protein n=1 Tax=Flavobacterium sp. 28A TaxID=2735895 RepID=UPI001570D3E4|nr:PKD-like domain-containing protein [Flavobacterium sp. 28A]NRT14925.1 putative repeat protein (TIGR01451 family)/gliding motility-associated-like protein [Flavobacterium sp. 28A]
MINKYSLLTLLLFLFAHTSYSQLSDLHYLPPLKQSSDRQAVVQQAFYLSTPETAPFTVQVFQGTGTTAVATLTVSNGSPVKYDVADGDNDITLVSNMNTGVKLSNSGLRFVAAGGQKFYVNYRGRSGAQATSLTSKGRQALGKKFKWGGIPNRANNASLTNTLGIMATTDGTIVTISGYDPNCQFRQGNFLGGISGTTTLTIELSAGQSYVLEASPNQTEANRDGWLGATISATENIAISNGGLNVGIRAGSGSRDAAIDQPVPQNIVGRDYVFVRGNGTNETEFPIIIGTQNGTDIFVNGSATPIATINDGEYFEIPGSNYSSGSIGANMTVITSKEAYAYQCLAGSSGIQTIGLNFIAPVNCLLPDNLSNIPDIRDVANLNFTGGITILASTSTPNANITVTDGSGVVPLPTPTNAAGLPWKSFFVSNLTGNVSVQSTGPIAVGFIGVNNNAGIAGYFSGFDTVPVVDLEITGGGCLPGSDLKELSGSFDAYQWFKDNTIIPGATSSSYTPSSPGDFFVRVTKGGCTYDSSILSAYNCDPEIILTKTVDKSNVLEGDTVIFKVSVKSLGVNPVTNLVINDLLPAELSFVSATAVHGTWTAPNWNIGTMTSGQVFNIFITAKVNEVSASSTVINSVSNSEDIPEADVQLDDDTEPIKITNSQIEVTKTSLAASDGSYDTVGELINYTITVKNTGDTNLTNIILTDPKADTGSISPSSVATLAIGASTTFTATHKITQADIEAGQVINSATAKATLSNGYVISDVSDDPTNATSTTNDPTVTPIIQKGKLVLEKIAQPADDGLYDNLGEKINYEIRVINTGNVSLNNITITDPKADTGTILPAVLANLPAGESAVFSAKHTIIQADFNVGKVSNIATVTGTEPIGGATITDQSDDPTTAAPNDATVVSVPEIGRLEVTKRDAAPADGSFDTVGEIITYTIFVKNTGTVTLKNLNIIDSNATGIIVSSTTGVNGDPTDKFVDKIEPGQTATFIATHVIKQVDLDKGKVQNTATAGAQDPALGSVTDLSDDPDNPNNAIDDPTITLMTAKPALSITKSVSDEFNVASEQTLTYTYVVTNNGNITIDNVSISDVHVGNGTLSLPAIQSTTGTDIDTSDNKIETLAPGQTATWTATYLVNQTDITNQQNITNTVTATGTPRIGTLTNPTANKIVTVHPIETICSNAVLNHNLATDGPFSGATFTWVAVANDEITGISTTAKNTSVINDAPSNQSTFDQIVQYNITVKNASGTTIDTYKYLVTIHSELEVPDDESVTVQCLAQATQPTAPVVKDYKGDTITPVITQNANPTCEGSKIYTYKYTDCGNNVSTYTYTYIIDRTTAPATIPADGKRTVQCIANATTPTPPTGIKDICGTTITAFLASTVDLPTTLTCEGSRTYNYTYTDCSGLVSKWKYTYTIDRTTAPATIPADGASTVECIANATTPTPPTGIKDICGTTITAFLASTVDSPTTLTCEGSRTFNYTYTDCSGLVSKWKYTYTIDLTTKPDVPTDAGSTVECLANATQPPAPKVTDKCGKTLTPVITASTNPTCEGTKVYTYTYTDCASNVSVYKYTYTIDLTTKPAVPINAGSTVECLAKATQPPTPAVTDKCGNTLTPVITASADPTCEGTKVYTYTYTDCASNVSVYKYTYTIDLTTKPVVPANAGSTVECLAKATQPLAPEVTDKCGNTLTPVITASADPTCEGTKVYTYTYTDCALNVSVYKYTYTIDLTTKPVVPANASSTVECLAKATQPLAPEVTDKCGNTLTPVITASADPTCEGTKVYTYTYTDCALNVSVYKYTYTIDLTTKPAVPTDTGSTVECLANATQPPAPKVTDKCGKTLTPVITASTNPTCEGTKVYTYTYTDCASNVSVYKYTYTIDLTTKPVVPADAGSTVECLANTTQPLAPAVTDKCGKTLTPVITVSNNPTCEGTKVYTYTYTDCASNVSVYKYTYTIDMTIKPIVPANGSANVNDISKAVQPTAPTVMDNCGKNIIPVITENTSPVCNGDKIYYFTYTDCSGNSTVYTYTYTIDVTSTLIISNKTKISCSDVALNYDLTKTTTLVNPTFSWVTTDNPNVTGEKNGTGTTISDAILNISGTSQTVKYTVTPFNNKGCQGPTFELVVTVRPEPSVSTNPTATSCSGIALNHNLSTDTNLAGTTFTWAAANNPNVSGETTTNSISTSIKDKLINTSGSVQTVVYTITPESAAGCIGKPYTYSVTVNPEATLVVTKITVPATDGQYDTVGEVIKYQITVENANQVSVSNLTLADLNADANSISPTSFANVAAFQKVIFTASHTITQNDLNTGLVTNSATGTAFDPCGTIVTDLSDDPNTATPNDNTVTNLVQKPVLALEKTFKFNDENGDGLVQNKETITYNFKVTNTGNVTISNISITDPLMTVNGGPINLTPNAVDATSFSGTYVITQGTIDSESLTNSATVKGTDPKGKSVTDISDDPSNLTNTDTNGNGNPDDNTVFAITAKPELTVEKTGVFIDSNGDGLAQVGETIQYSFEVSNTGNVTITGITINDPLSPVLGGPITLIPGKTDSTTFATIYTLTQSDINKGNVTNAATASGKSPSGKTITDDSDDPTTATNNDATVTKLTQNALITLLKRAVFNDENGNGFPDTGETISYNFTVKNNGNVTVSGITITDPLTTVSGGPITLAPNKSDTTTFKATYTIKLTDINAGNVTNTATATGKDPDGKVVATLSDDPTNPTNVDSDNDGHPDDATLTKLGANAKLSVTKTGVFKDENNDGIAQVGETITYTFEVSNIGNVSVTGIKITDPIVAVTGGPIALDPNQKNTTTFNATYALTQADIDAAKVTNTAIASGLTPKGITVSDTSDDPNNPTNVDSNGNGEPDDATVTTIPGKGKISLIKTTLAPTDGSYDTVGEKINYLLTITNTGNLTLTNIVVADANADTGSILPAVITTLAPGNSATVNASHSITQSEIDLGSVTNSATVSATDSAGQNNSDTSDDPNNPTNADANGDGEPDDATITAISQKPAISLEKTFTFNDENKDGFPQVNETITYNFTVKNSGKVTLSNILVTDALVAVNGGPITLAPAEVDAHTFYATYKITQANIDSGAITNSASVKSTDTNGNPVTDVSDDPNNPTNTDTNGDGNPDDATVTTLARKPELSVTKTGTFIDANKDGLAQVGETIRYHFEITNTGNVTVSNITISDALVAVTGNPITLAPKAKNTTNFVAIYTLTQDDVNTGFVINTATASGQDPFGGTVSDTSDDPTTAAKNDDTNTSLTREPQLSLFKTATFNDENGDGLPQSNETISYNFDIRNNGNVTIFGIKITDPLVTITGGPIDLDPADIDVTSFTALYTIKQSDIDSGSITNTALAVGQDKDGANVTDVSDFSDDPDNPTDEDLNGDGDPDDPTVSSLTGKAALSITKTATFNDTNSNGFANVGETISYVFEVNNIGNLTLTNVIVTDPIVTVNGAAISLAPGQKNKTTFTAVYSLTQEDLDTGKVTNTAVASGEDPNGIVVKDFSDDPNNLTNADINNDGNPDDVTITNFPVEGKISIIKTALAAADGAYDTIGEKITYTIIVTNTGSTTLSNIKITDLNADLGSVVPSAITVLNPGKSVTITALHTVTQADLNSGSVSNSATVTSKDALGNTVSDISDDPNNPANVDANADGDPDDATVSAMVQKPQMQLTKASTLAPDGLWDTVGEVILYNLELTNTGNVTLTNITVTDTNADAGSIIPANFVTLLPGQKVTLKAQHTITQIDLDKGAVTNTAVATAKDPKGGNVTDDSDDPNNDTNTDTNGDGEPDDATVTVTPQLAILNVTKVTSNDTFTHVGDPINYTIVVTNIGNINLLNVNVRDNNGTFTSQSSINVLAPGKSFTITAQHLVTADDILFGYIDNTAVVHALIPNSTVTIEEDSDDPTNATNVDIDNDGDFEDPTTSFLDTDSDGIADITDIDDDNDGILDTVEGTVDSDSDGIPNYLDIDADNDGIPDNLEAQTTAGYKAPSKIDANKNGLDDIYETAASIGLVPVNTDGTDTPDYLDTDSDNDGVADIIEAFDKNKDGIPDIFISGNDADKDGLDDSFEGANTMDGFVVNNEFKNGSSDTNNTDGADEPDYRDTDDDNDGVFTKYEIDPNGDKNGPDDTDKDGIPDYLDTDDDGDGLSTRKEGADPNGDGNPDDAIDANANGFPDYLEVGNFNPNIPDDEIEVYNFISANTDGKNDALVLGRIFEYPENTVQIYNRWGVLVYETTGYGTRNNYFRGYSEGRVTISKDNKLPTGTYFYVIKYRSGQNNKQKAGFLYLQQ